MSPRTWLERIDDILICAHNIQDFTKGMSLDDFLGDPRTSHAVAFEFTTMGEAARAMPTEVQKRHPQLPGTSCRQSAMYWYTSIFASMKKFSGEPARKTFHP